MNKALIQAITSDTKALEDAAEDRAEIKFMLDNWNIFTPSKKKLIDAFKYLPDPTADSLLKYLGYSTVFIDKVEEVRLKNACYDMLQSVLWKDFKAKQKQCRDLTVFYVTGKQGIVVTNQYMLTPEKDFYHKLVIDKGSDIYWCSIRQTTNSHFKVY